MLCTKLHFLFLVVGVINLFLVGLFSWDIGETFGGQGATLFRVIFVLVGVSAIYEIVMHVKNCGCCVARKKSFD
ncbi:MAG: DUF378 domain-containing protein [Patescibacteria group bacterium]|nr:DUF378 domain-containing protein [Patescibacteria group bacterium]